MKRNFVVFIHGSTGTGKSDLAVQAAVRLGAEIINCDSVQVYKSLNVGAAKPSKEQMSAVSHHLFGHVEDGAAYTAGQYRQDALNVIERRSREGQRLFLVVGGSGFYSQALLKGMYPVPPSDPSVREVLNREMELKGVDGLFAELKRLDPDYAKKVGGNDPYRIVRALEILRMTEFKTMGDVQKAFDAQTPPFQFVQIGLRHLKVRLREKIEKRTGRMIKEGLIEETKCLLDRGFYDWPALRSVGYSEACEHLSGRLSLTELLESIVQSTVQLAKRQNTWFRRDKRIIWFDTDHDRSAPLVYLDEATRGFRDS